MEKNETVTEKVKILFVIVIIDLIIICLFVVVVTVVVFRKDFGCVPWRLTLSEQGWRSRRLRFYIAECCWIFLKVVGSESGEHLFFSFFFLTF